MKVIYCLLVAGCITFTGAAQTYLVKKIVPGAVQVSGKGDSRGWGQANVLTHFVYPWDSAAPPATSFAALWDGEWLYLLYRVKDDSVIVPVKKNDKKEVGASDRVEIFLTTNPTLTPYYCLELDALARVLDYTASYYRKMDYDWQWPRGQLIVKSSPTPDGYVVEAAISIRSLKELGLLKNGRLLAGLFRAENMGVVNGRADLRWISWVRPTSSKPDFHIPSAFGVLVLQ
ncbi:MAG TPA: sugar-binding protein [Puia sp.]|nr:sugar-binding protein [Puia sp.]